MEFLPYNEVLQTLAEQGVHERVGEELVRFELRAEKSHANPMGQVQRVVLGTANCASRGGVAGVTG